MNLSTPSSRRIRAIYTLCLAGACYNHLCIVFEHGIAWNYGGMPRPVSLFWTALTLLDALAVVLLWVRPRAGLILTAAIIMSDVAINGWVAANYGADWKALAAQVLFLLLVLGTVRIAWRGVRANQRRLFSTRS